MICRDANAPKRDAGKHYSLLECDTMQPGINFLFTWDTGKLLSACDLPKHSRIHSHHSRNHKSCDYT
jgi:hypothetical protein